MNIIITLPMKLWERIMTGEKTIELRKDTPRNFNCATDKCYVILKGTDILAGWIYLDSIKTYPKTEPITADIETRVTVSRSWIDNYLAKADSYSLWYIRNHEKSYDLESARQLFCIRSNPQSYIYTNVDLKPTKLA